MKRLQIRQIYKAPDEYKDQKITVAGWARTIRASNLFGFIELNDGSCFKNLQVVFEDSKLSNYKEISGQNVGCSLVIEGTLVHTPEAKQPFELHAEHIEVEGTSAPEFPLQKKKHSMEYLRTIAHLRPRTNTFSAVFRVRSAAAYEPAGGSYKRKEEVRCLKTADFTKTPDFLHLRTARACSGEENAQDKKV